MRTTITHTWQSGAGATIVATARGDNRFDVTLDGVQVADNAYLNTNPRAIPDAAYRAGMRGILLGRSHVGLTAERVTALQSVDALVTAAQAAARAADPRTALRSLEMALSAARQALTEYGYGATGARGAAVAQAEAALADWQSAHVEVWTQVVAERQIERARRAEELRPAVERARRGED